MTIPAQGRAPPQPQSKAASTVQSSRLAAIADHGNSKPNSRNHSRARLSKPRQETAPSDFSSETATLSLIRRILAPEKNASLDPRATPKPIEDILPPLTSSNDVDVQLYAIVAVIVKDFVNTWYSNITPDHHFVDEIIQIIAHCSRAVEQRLRQIDVAEIFLNEVPALLESHVNSYRTACMAAAEHRYSTSVHRIYHVLDPHPALEPPSDDETSSMLTEQMENERSYRQLLVQGALAVLLPTEDLQNTPLRTLVSDVIADLIIGQALGGKMCEGWFIHEAVRKVATAVKDFSKVKDSGQELHDTKTRLEKFGLLNSKEPEVSSSLPSSYQSITTIWFWRILQGTFLIFLGFRFFIKGITHARRTPSRSSVRPPAGGSRTLSKSAHVSQQSDLSTPPILAYHVYSTVSTLIRFERRMPWITSVFKFWQHVLLFTGGGLASTNSVLDRFLHDTITTHVFPAKIIPPILLNLRIALFPNNSLGPPAPPPPSADEQLMIRRGAAESLLSLIPPVVAKTYYNSSEQEEMLQQIEMDILDAFGDSYLNKHLIYRILELILCRLVPELTEGSVSELLAERGVDMEEQTRDVEPPVVDGV